MDAPGIRRTTGYRDWVGRALEWLGVAGMAIAVPMLGVLGKNTEILLNFQPGRLRILLLLLAIVLLPPALLIAVEALIRVGSDRVAGLFHSVGITVLFAVAVVRLVREATHLPGAINLAVSLAITAAFAFALRRWQSFHSWLRLLSLVPVGTLLLTIAASPVTPIIEKADTQPIAREAFGTPHRIVWVVFDEFPLTSILDGQQGIDEVLFPNFAALQRTSTWYRNSTTVAPFTLGAVPAMLTGRDPYSATAAAVPANYPRNAFSALSGAFTIHAHESLTRLCAPYICTATQRTKGSRTLGVARELTRLWAKGLDPRLTDAGMDIRGLLARDPDPAASASQFIDAMRPSAPHGKQQFDFLHVFVPHWPWQYDGQLRVVAPAATPPGLVGGEVWRDRESARMGREYHLRTAQAADTILGLVRARLESFGEWTNSIVVVTADHGVGFAPREPARGHSPHNAADLAWTPLFIKAPGQTSGAVDDRLARTTDILPTVADHLGTRLPWRADGRSLLGRPRPNGDFTMTAWKLDTVPATDGVTTVDGVAGFARVLASGGRGTDCAPALRLYCAGRYRTLMGRSVAGLTGGQPDPSRRAVVTNPEKFDAVDPATRAATWLSIEGAILGLRRPADLAVAVNGAVAGLTRAVPYQQITPFWTALAPGAFRPGRNTVEVFAISGSAANPVLTSLGPRAAAG
ncbi:MAG: sulfatase-like hydrolase/transferase [Actinomycetes bacterium]